jgi:GDPmannose 4,6-dehydratase
MLQQPKADDYVIAMGETHSIRELLGVAFGKVRLDWEEYVTVDPHYYRPTEVDILQGDSTKARTILGWKPKWSFRCLIEDMVDYDLAVASKEVGISRVDQQ